MAARTLHPTTPVLSPQNPQQWRTWLEAHHASETGIWLIYYKKSAAQPTLTWSEAVDEALCFGWIDSQAKPLDAERYMQFFSPRKSRSGWSRVNKEKVARLTAAGRLAPAGQACIETARHNGSWTLLDAVEALQLPDDLTEALHQHPGAHAFFVGLSRSDQRTLLQWLVLAKRPATRHSRLQAVVTRARQQLRPLFLENQRKRPTPAD